MLELEFANISINGHSNQLMCIVPYNAVALKFINIFFAILFSELHNLLIYPYNEHELEPNRSPASTSQNN